MKIKRVKLQLLSLSIYVLLLSFSSCNNNNDNIEDETFIEQDNTDSSDNTDNNDISDGITGTSSGDQGEITLYSVANQSLTKVKDFEVTGAYLTLQNDTEKHDAIWEMVKKVIPESNMDKISEFLIYAGATTETLGFVIQTNDDLSKWKYAIAIDLAYESGTLNGDGELLHTIIHEFGHVVTLNNDQVDASIDESSCTNFFVGEGCAKSNAYINLLQTKYWDDIWDEYNNIGSEEAQNSFFTKYQDRFVTDYAATNPGEDIAEVFAAFVQRAGGVNGTSIAEQKIQLMYDETELTNLRTFIRSSDLYGASSKNSVTRKSTRKFKCLTNLH